MEDVKENIIKMVGEIENKEILMLIQGFVKSGYNEERAGK